MTTETLLDLDFIRRFEAFARSKPADEEYDASDADRCALGQFGHYLETEWDCDEAGVPEAAFNAVFPSTTFGALADRLASLRASAKDEGR